MKTPLPLSGRRYAMAITLAIAVVSAACGGNGERGSGTTAAENPSSGVNGTAGSAGPAGAGQRGAAATPTTAPEVKSGGAAAGATRAGLPAAVDRLLDRAHSAERATYTATWNATLAGGARATVRLAQQAPRFRFEQTQGRQRSVTVFDGKVLHGCVPAGGGWRCTQAVTVDDPSLGGNAYPPAVLLFIDHLTPMVNRSLRAGITTRTVMGRKVDCVTFTPVMRYPPPPSVYCVGPGGVLAYSRTSDRQVLELTGFRAAVNTSELVPPR